MLKVLALGDDTYRVIDARGNTVAVADVSGGLLRVNCECGGDGPCAHSHAVQAVMGQASGLKSALTRP